MSPLQYTLKHLLGALVIVGLGLLIAPRAPAFDVQSLKSLLYPWQSQPTTGGPVQVRGIASWLFIR